MTRAEKDRTTQALLTRYRHQVGRVIVSDDSCLARLLGTLRLDLEDPAVGNYLCSYLVA
jgi:hypothetical protein